MTEGVPTEALLRELAPQVLGALVRRFGHFDSAEEAVQEALLAAAMQWPESGLPRHPKGWLITVAFRRMTDQLRAEQARRRREQTVATRQPTDQWHAPPADATTDHDDTLTLMFLCCHPALTLPSQIALTLRAVAGLSTAEIARAFLVPETTMGQRISRAKQTLKSSDVAFALPPQHERAARIQAVTRVLYLLFNEGYTATAGAALQRRELASEAIRLTRLLHRLLPREGEVAGLLALMLLTDARRDARVGPDGALVPLADQDRGRWDRPAITEGVALVEQALATAVPGPYQLQAAIAAIHDEAPTAAETDWPQILAFYRLLTARDDDPVLRLNHAVAAAMVEGPAAGLAMLEPLDDDPRMIEHHRLDAVRAHLWEMAGQSEQAISLYRSAAAATTSIPERHYLEERASRLRMR